MTTTRARLEALVGATPFDASLLDDRDAYGGELTLIEPLGETRFYAHSEGRTVVRATVRDRTCVAITLLDDEASEQVRVAHYYVLPATLAAQILAALVPGRPLVEALDAAFGPKRAGVRVHHEDGDTTTFLVARFSNGDRRGMVEVTHPDGIVRAARVLTGREVAARLRRR